MAQRIRRERERSIGLICAKPQQVLSSTLSRGLNSPLTPLLSNITQPNARANNSTMACVAPVTSQLCQPLPSEISASPIAARHYM